jgi:hypothetical protein
MSDKIKDLENKIRVERVTVSCALSDGRRGDGDFVSLTVKSIDGEFSLEEAHLIHKIVSREATEMAYMDSLAKGHKTKSQISAEWPVRRKNFDMLISSLSKKLNKE